MGLSALNDQRADYSVIDDRCCPRCDALNENVLHFFLDCPHYSAIRLVILDKLERLLHPSGIQVITENPAAKRNLINSNYMVVLSLPLKKTHRCHVLFRITLRPAKDSN